VKSSLVPQLKRIEEIKARKSVYGETLGLLEKILVERERSKELVDAELSDEEKGAAQRRLSQGFPALDRNELELDVSGAEEFLKRVMAIVRESNPGGIKALESALGRRTFPLERLLASVLRGEIDAFDAGSEGVDKGLLIFLAHEVVKLFLTVRRDLYALRVDEEGWKEGFCPFCGGMPFLAEFRGEEGKRFLFCGDCETEWRFSRFTCPFCKNDDQQKMGYFSAEGEDHYRVYYCENCKGYLKTVDSRETEKKVFPEIENLATLHLDFAAKKEGLKTEALTVRLLV
jgi:FdhE protein